MRLLAISCPFWLPFNRLVFGGLQWSAVGIRVSSSRVTRVTGLSETAKDTSGKLGTAFYGAGLPRTLPNGVRACQVFAAVHSGRLLVGNGQAAAGFSAVLATVDGDVATCLMRRLA